MLGHVLGDEAHQRLAQATLTAAFSEYEITVESVSFGDRDPEAAYSWLCYLADPATDDRMAGLTMRSASDHFKRYDSNGVLANAARRIDVRVYELETSSEATFVLVGERDEDVLFSPWQVNLVLVRATFNYYESSASV